MEAKQKITLDFVARGATPLVHVVQGDAGTRVLEIDLFAAGVAWQIPTGMDVALRYKKPDGTQGLYTELPDGTKAATVDTTNKNRVTLTLAPQTMTVAGDVIADLAITDTANVLASFAIIIRVHPNPAAEPTESTDYYKYQSLGDINRALTLLEAASGRAVYKVNGVVPDAEGNVNTPGAGTGGEVVSVNGKNGIVVLTMGDVAYSGAGAHNAIYRGKYLGSAVTAAQWAAITEGSFTDLYIGDYWTIGGINYRIAAFDYYLGAGDTECTEHHVVIVPDKPMYSAKMYDTNVTSAAYGGSLMRNSGLDAAKNAINNAFGADHILNHRQYLKNATVNGYETAGAWYGSTVEIMTEQNVYGGKILANSIHGANWAAQQTIDKSQYPLFVYRTDLIGTRSTYWLRDVATASSFCAVNASGYASNSYSSNDGGVRPSFCIYGG